MLGFSCSGSTSTWCLSEGFLWHRWFQIFWIHRNTCACIRFTAVCFDDPIVLPIILELKALHNILEKASESYVIRLFLKPHITTHLDIASELLWRAHAKLLDSGLAFFLFDFVVLLIFIFTAL